jgi:hypothetical protein
MCPLFVSDFNETLNFPYRFSENAHISNFMKIRSVGAELFYADRRLDNTNLTVTLSQYCEHASKYIRNESGC